MSELTLQTVIDRLNPQQKEATLNTVGPELIIAGAGSGKTSVLTTRIALILDKGIAPERVLALTFTKKAADEMKSRIITLYGEDAKRLCMGTFHSVFIKFIRPYASLIGFPPNFTILDEEDSLSCLKRCINAVVFPHREEEMKAVENDVEASKKLESEYKTLEQTYKPKEIRNRISSLKNRLISAELYSCSMTGTLNEEDERKAKEYKKDSRAYINADIAARKPLFWRIYSLYAETCRRSGTMDFDDILLYTYELMYRFPDVARYIGACFDYIMVDEFQDTNTAQMSILQYLTANNHNICVVGDDSQSIYAFRGAKIDNIFNFKKEYKGCAIYKLERNYRSTKEIVNSANRLIEHNENRIPKVCFSESRTEGAIQMREFGNENGEALFVANAVAGGVSRNAFTYKDCAVLYRTNSQSRALEDAFIKKGIPYVIYSGTSFFDRMEVKDQMAYFKLAVNPNDDESVRRVINKPVRGLGGATMEKISTFAMQKQITLWQAFHDPELVSCGLPARASDGLNEFMNLIQQAYDMSLTETAEDLARWITDKVGFYDAYVNAGDEDSMKRADNIRELVDSVSSYEEDIENMNRDADEDKKVKSSLIGYLQSVMLLSNSDTKNDDNKVSLMTAHCAKGLEFTTVFVTGMEKGLFPLEIEKTDFEREEERRLFYVATTRAKKYLFLTRAETRMRFGSREETDRSPFLAEFLNEEDMPEPEKPKYRYSKYQKSSYSKKTWKKSYR